MYISFIPKSPCINGWDIKSNSNFIHIISKSLKLLPRFDVVKGHDEEIEACKEGYRELSYIFVMGFNLQAWIQIFNSLFSY